MLLSSKPPAANGSGAHEATSHRDDGVGPPPPRLCALIVDPDRDTRDALRQLLGNINIAVLEAETADEARTCLAAHPVHIALIEVNLPGHAGDRLATELASAGIAPVLMCADPYGVARARRTMFEMLRKPFTVKQALRAIVLALPA